jgi:hypothetical protein
LRANSHTIRWKKSFGGISNVRNRSVLDTDRDTLLLVKGGTGSKLLGKAMKQINEEGEDSIGRPLKVPSHDMRRIFGDLGGKNSLQRSTPRKVSPDFGRGAAEYVRSLDC